MRQANEIVLPVHLCHNSKVMANPCPPSGEKKTMYNMKHIAAAIVIFTGGYITVGAWQASFTSVAPPLGNVVGYAIVAIGLWLLFVTWAETKATDRPLWLRFKLRDLFWLTLLVALLAAWFVDHREMQGRLDTTATGVGGGGFGGGGFGGGGLGGGPGAGGGS